MGRTARFEPDQILQAAARVLADRGPSGATIAAIAAVAGAPTGSVYHRFESRKELLAEVWLRTVERFQAGFLEALARDPIEAALFTPRFAREHFRDAKVLLLHRREELASGPWPRELRERAARLGAELDHGLRDLARDRSGHVDAQTLRRASFATIEIPYAAVRPHLVAGEAPPPFLDELVATAARAVLEEP